MICFITVMHILLLICELVIIDFYYNQMKLLLMSQKQVAS